MRAVKTAFSGQDEGLDLTDGSILPESGGDEIVLKVGKLLQFKIGSILLGEARKQKKDKGKMNKRND